MASTEASWGLECRDERRYFGIHLSAMGFRDIFEQAKGNDVGLWKLCMLPLKY